MSEIEKFVIGIYSRNSQTDQFQREGYGFLIGRYVITAAHVVNRYIMDTIYLGIPGCKSYTPINIQNLINREFTTSQLEKNYLDYAIFNFDHDCFARIPTAFQLPKVPDTINSPLRYTNKEINKGDIVTLVNWDKEVTCRVTETSARHIAINKDGELLKLNFPTCFSIDNSEEQICAGDSGSPVLKDGKVVGMLIMGTPKERKDKFRSIVNDEEILNSAVCLKISEIIQHIQVD